MTTDTDRLNPRRSALHCAACDGTGTIARPVRARDGRAYLRGDLCPRCAGVGRAARPDTDRRRIPLAAALRVPRTEGVSE